MQFLENSLLFKLKLAVALAHLGGEAFSLPDMKVGNKEKLLVLGLGSLTFLFVKFGSNLLDDSLSLLIPVFHH